MEEVNIGVVEEQEIVVNVEPISLEVKVYDGEKGEKGDTALSVAVGTTTTGLPGTNANVENVGTNQDLILNFTIPKGADGDDGNDGVSPTVTTSKTGKVTTITITDATGTHTATINDGADGSGTGDMLKSTYDTDNDGIVDNAEKVNNHTVLTDVPANAVFTDTVYDDTEVKSDITAIESKIPNQATSSNQLADKNFVNSSISTSTATFKGTYNTLAELQQQTADDNDYGFVISTDSASNTLYNRYKYNGTTWAFEYSLNNSSFTASQWSAIQSGITSALVSAFNSKYNKPSGGIPKTDLASDVQTSLGKADSSLQSVPAASSSSLGGLKVRLSGTTLYIRNDGSDA